MVSDKGIDLFSKVREGETLDGCWRHSRTPRVQHFDEGGNELVPAAGIDQRANRAVGERVGAAIEPSCDHGQT